MIPFIDDGSRSRLVLAGGVVAVAAATVVGVVRTVTMPAMPGMPGMAGGGDEVSHRLHGMPLSDMPEMWVAALGMALVLVGAVTARRAAAAPAAASPAFRHRVVGVIGFLGLTIDISKTSTLGFVIPGMRAEYGIGAGAASLLAVAGLAGTAVGAVLLGSLSDRIGRRRTYLIATLAFAATSMCGSMPTFTGNLVMCSLMGLAVGGLAPLLVTVLADACETRRRRATLLGVSVAATAVGYLVAAGSALWLEPLFGWRVLWLIGAPTGIALLLLAPWIPARPAETERPALPSELDVRALSRRTQQAYAFLVGVITFGLTTWVPTLARGGGISSTQTNVLLTVSALVLLPCALIVIVCYRRFGPTTLLLALTAGTAVLLVALTAGGMVTSVRWLTAGVLVAALFAANTMTGVFLPISADLAEPSRRGRTTGRVSLFHRIGGLCGPLLLAGLVTSTTDVLWAVSILAAMAALAVIVIAMRQRSFRRQLAGEQSTPRPTVSP